MLKKDFLFPGTFSRSLKNSADSYLCFRLTLLHSVSCFFFLYRSPSLLLCRIFDSISSKIDEVLLISSSPNVFVFGDFNIHHKDWVTYSHSPAVLDVFLSSGASICSTMAFPHLEVLIMFLSQFPLTFHQIYNGMPHFIA